MPAKTMEEVASYGNLKEAFKQVASNKGAPGPDGKSIEEVRVRLGEIISLLHEKLLDESYRVGMSRRVWIPKPGGKGERGLGIPNVIDRIVQQAVQQVLSPHYEPTFHGRQPWISSWAQLSHSHRGAKSYLDDGYEWVVDMDLEKFLGPVNFGGFFLQCHSREGGNLSSASYWNNMDSRLRGNDERQM